MAPPRPMRGCSSTHSTNGDRFLINACSFFIKSTSKYIVDINNSDTLDTPVAPQAPIALRQHLVDDLDLLLPADKAVRHEHAAGRHARHAGPWEAAVADTEEAVKRRAHR